MRISTAQFQQQGLEHMLRQQTQLARTQQQLASGQRIQSAKDDPAGSGRAVNLAQSSAQFGRYQAQIDTARTRLNFEESALAQATNVLQRVRELAIQISGPGQGPQTRQGIAMELRALRDTMLSIANAGDGQGHYLFGGGQDQTPPFSMAGGRAHYAGDQQQRLMDISSSRSVADADSGDAVFLRMKSGNGLFAVSADAGNRGTAVLAQTRVTDAHLFSGGPFSLRFSAGEYVVNDAAGGGVSSGAYRAGEAISFRGVSIVLTGTPQEGDTFSIAPSAPLDVFAQIERLAQLAEHPVDAAAQGAQRDTGLQQGLQALEQADAHLSGVRASVGHRLAALDDAETYNAAQREQALVALAEIQDLDYADAATRLSRQLTALQAAQQTLARVQGLSLFDYLR